MCVYKYTNFLYSYGAAVPGREKGRHAKGGVLDSIQVRLSVKGSPSYVLFHDNTRSKRNFLFFLEKNPACAVFFFFRWSSIEITSRLTYLFMRVEEAESLTSFLLFFSVIVSTAANRSINHQLVNGKKKKWPRNVEDSLPSSILTIICTSRGLIGAQISYCVA